MSQTTFSKTIRDVERGEILIYFNNGRPTQFGKDFGFSLTEEEYKKLKKQLKEPEDMEELK